MVAVALIFAACTGDSGNNGTEVEGGSSSSAAISSSGGEVTSSSGDDFSGSGISSGFSSSSDLSSPANGSSSSAETVLSSSSLAASSSSAKAAWDYLNPNITYGEMTDTRDSQTYKTVVIGTQTWMAENLNYADSAAMPNLAGNSWCYENSADSCAKYGRLYTWTAAMNIDNSYLSTIASAVVSTPQQGACPSDWHMPTDGDWTTLMDSVGGSRFAAEKLKSDNGWFAGKATDAYGFSALAAGYRYDEGGFNDAGKSEIFWSAKEYNANSVAYWGMISVDVSMLSNGITKGYALSVRCVKDL